MATPILSFRTLTGATITGLAFGTVPAGDESDVSEVFLFNNFQGPVIVDEALDVRVSVLDFLGLKDDEPIKEGWVLTRSAGTTNPNNTANFFDDSQAVFTPLTSVQDLLIGNIPSGAGRKLFFKLKVPTDAPTQTGLTVQFIAGHGSNVSELPFFFNRAFGDGVVQETKKQIYPAVFLNQITTYSVDAFVGAAYTGDEDKDYIVEIVAGGTPGVATYKVSDDNEVSFSSTIASATVAFTNILTSNDEDEGVDIGWGAGVRLETGDKWRVSVETRPFQFKAGVSTSLEGFVGAGEALIANNRIRHTQATPIILGASTQTFVFLGVDGTFSINSTSSNPQAGQLLMGWFETDTNGVIDQEELFPFVTLGLDLFDDFTPQFDQIVGLTWAFFQGRFRKFNEVVRVPPVNLIGTITLIAGVTNFIQVDPLAEEVITSDFGYLQDHIPLFRVKTRTKFIDAFVDDRAPIGVPILNQLASFTTATVLTGATTEFDFTGFTNRALIRKTVITPSTSGTGYTVTFYERDTKQSTDIEYQAGTLPNPFEDDFLWWHHDRDSTSELHGIILNETGLSQQFTIDFELEQFA